MLENFKTLISTKGPGYVKTEMLKSVIRLSRTNQGTIHSLRNPSHINAKASSYKPHKNVMKL